MMDVANLFLADGGDDAEVRRAVNWLNAKYGTPDAN
jgi:hypothetical protein